MRRHRKGQPHIYPAGIVLHRRVRKLIYLCEPHDLLKLRIDLPLLHARYGTVEVDIPAARKFRMEPGAHFRQTAHPAREGHFALRGMSDAGQDIQQGGVACAVAAGDADDLAAVYFEVDVAQGSEDLILLIESPHGLGGGGADCWL